jgi:serine/threonine protein kinase
MEYIEGSDLKDIDPKTLTVQQRLIIAKLCCQALKHIHEGRFIHGDIKPANIKVKIEGDNISVRFMDFGFSLELKENQVKIDNIPASFGTDNYIAPEVKKGFFVGYVSDIYSLGYLFRTDLLLKGICDEMTSHVADRRPSLDDVISRLDLALSQFDRKIIQNLKA